MTPAIFGIAGATLSAAERGFFAEADPVGYILFGRNCESKSQLRALTDDLRAIHGRDRLVISVDQEGGRVRRLKPPVWLEHPPGAAYAGLYDIAPISAIEAARAGEHGRGFAIVADEVRNLAQKTHHATKEIVHKISAIQQATHEFVIMLSQEVNEAGAGRLKMTEVSGVFAKMQSKISEVVKRGQEIVHATESQTTASHTFLCNMQHIATIAGQTAREVSDIASSINRLKEMSASLSTEVGRFNVDEVESPPRCVSAQS